MNITLPPNAGTDLASTSASFIAGISSYATLIIGTAFAFFVIESIIYILSNKKKNNDEN